MWLLLLLAIAVLPAARFALLSPKPKPRGTLLDCMDEESVVALVRIVSRDGESAEALAARMERLFLTFPPTEAVMRRLSLMQQRCEGKGGFTEYCVVTVYAVAMLGVGKRQVLHRRRATVP